MATYDFSIIRVCPDPRRGELVNIGLAIFLNDRIDVRILPSLSKVHALHADFDTNRLYSIGDAYNNIVQNGCDAKQRHSTIRKLGAVELSDLGRFSANSCEQFESAIKTLMSKLVVPTVVKRVAFKRSKLYGDVRGAIKCAGLLGEKPEDISHRLCVPRFPISAEQGLYADFAMKNGVYHVTEVIDFNVSKT